jgi:hypothetical protein
MFHVTISLNNSNIGFIISIMIGLELLLQVTRCLLVHLEWKLQESTY